LLDTFTQTLRTLWAHKLRSFLTMFGIAWGVGSLLLLVGLGEGFRSGNRRELEEIGKDIMFLFGGRVPAMPGSHTATRRYFLTYDDYLSIKNEARHIRNVAPVLSRGDIRIVSEHASSGGQVTGVTANFNEIRYLPMGVGRWLNDLDNEQQRNVAIIGDETVKNLFPGYPALGSTILLNGHRFEVVGILSKIGQGDNNSSNSRVFVPFQSMAKLFPVAGESVPPNAISFINYQPRIRGQHLVSKEEVRKLIARNHGFDHTINEAFQDWDTIESEKTVGKIFDAMNMFLGSVGIVTLFLGAIGIINIMLVSVTERTKEIGLRKALGATNRNVMFQFFLEGAFLTLLSGGVGIAFAAGLMAALSGLPSPEGFDPPKLVASSAMLAVACLSVAGIAAGLYPARKAALLTPVEALRAE
jgi:putative ABC transport system permease protein